MSIQDTVNLGKVKIGELQKQIDDLQAQIVSLTAQKDLHSSAIQALDALSPELKDTLDALNGVVQNG